MAPSDIFFIVGAFSLFAIAMALIPVLLQYKRTLRKTENLVECLNKHADPLCKSLTEAASELQILSLSLNDKLEQSDAILKNVKNSTETLLLMSSMAKDTVKPFITGFGGLAAGVRAFSYFLAKSGRKK